MSFPPPLQTSLVFFSIDIRIVQMIMTNFSYLRSMMERTTPRYSPSMLERRHIAAPRFVEVSQMFSKLIEIRDGLVIVQLDKAQGTIFGAELRLLFPDVEERHKIAHYDRERQIWCVDATSIFLVNRILCRLFASEIFWQRSSVKVNRASQTDVTPDIEDLCLSKVYERAVRKRKSRRFEIHASFESVQDQCVIGHQPDVSDSLPVITIGHCFSSCLELVGGSAFARLDKKDGNQFGEYLRSVFPEADDRRQRVLYDNSRCIWCIQLASLFLINSILCVVFPNKSILQNLEFSCGSQTERSY